MNKSPQESSLPKNQEQQEPLTPQEVADLLKITKNTVYELIKRGELPAYRAGKKIRVERADIEAFKNATKRGAVPIRPEQTPDQIRNGGFPCPDREASSLERKRSGQEAFSEKRFIICGQEALLDALSRKLERGGGQSEAVLRSYGGSYDALIALYNDEVQLAGIHLWDGESNQYNVPFLRRLLPGTPAALFRLARRKAGLYVRAGNPLGLRGWDDLARPGVVMVNRERGSGTRILLDEHLRRLGVGGPTISGYERECLSSLMAAGIVARGGADVAVGPENAASQARGVEFIPLQDECYDLAVRRERLDSPIVRRALAILSSDEFKEETGMLLGYDLEETGKLIAET